MRFAWMWIPLVIAPVSQATAASAASITFVVRPPSATPAGASLWISGDRSELGNWNGAGLPLTRNAIGEHVASLTLTGGEPFEFKVTRGSWETVEKDARGGEIANRRATHSGSDDTLRIDVAAWRDQGETTAPRTSTITGDVRRHAQFESAHVPARDVWVWLPPGYEESPERRYPVVYFHDGQNVLDGATSFLPGMEWRADEVASDAIRRGALQPFMMVAVANSSARMREYTSSLDRQHGGGGSPAYFRFLIEELKPFINGHYRTLTIPSETTVIGSSLGGLAALELGLLHPEHFGRVGSISPSVGWSDTAILRRVRASSKLPLRIWLDMGTLEGTPRAEGASSSVLLARRLRDALIARGWREGVDLHHEEFEGARHDESAWAARIGSIFQWLLTSP